MQFVEQHGTEDVLQHPKVVAKMAKPVRRTKEMLSANTEAPFMVEEMFQGIDFASSITRDEFESISGATLRCMYTEYMPLVALRASGHNPSGKFAARNGVMLLGPCKWALFSE